MSLLPSNKTMIFVLLATVAIVWASNNVNLVRGYIGPR